jgi:hypothetical protein
LQQIKSTLTYLEGATFQAITGVVARSASMDDDGNGAGSGAQGAGAGPKRPEVPAGYEAWKKNMTATAEAGIAALQAAWGAETSNGFRGYAATDDATWWVSTKRKAANADKAKKEAAQAEERVR